MTIKEKSDDRRLVEQALLEVAPRGTITIGDLNRLCPGRDFRAKDSGMMSRILKALCREHGVVFDNVRGVGYQRADDTLKAGGTSEGMQRARRVMKRHVVDRVGAIENFAALPLAQKTVAVVNGSIAAAMLYATKKSTLKQLGDEGSGGGAKVLPPIETLRRLAQGKKAEV